MNTAFTPEIPIISRYCAPWDADGWYYVLRNFGKKSKIYSNADIYVDKFDKALAGADYIVTYDSQTDGTDDHQESDFYVERRAVVYVCFDSKAKEMCALPEWLDSDWEFTDYEIKTSGGAVYSVFSKTFTAGSHIIIPGFRGNYPNYFVLASRDSETGSEPLARAPKTKADIGKYIPRTYQCYLSECFNSGIPSDFVRTGDVSLISVYPDEKYKSVRLAGTSSLSKKLDCGKNIIARTSVNLLSPSGEYTFGALKASGGKLLCGDTVISEAEFGKSTALLINYDFEKMTAAFTVNHIKTAENVKFDAAQLAEFTCKNGEMLVDSLYIYDDTELFVCDENFNAAPALSLSPNISAEIIGFPFDENKSLRLSSKEGGACAYDFPSVSGILTLETRVYVSSDGCVKISAEDSDSNTAACAALYKNSVFASSGDEWINITDDLTPYCYYPAKNWYEVRFVIDTKARKYDFWLDGAKRACGLPLVSKTASVSRIGFSVESDTVLYVNRVRVYDSADLCRNMTFGQIFDVKKFGAKGNGKTDDTAAINKAVAAAAYSGGTVYVGDGIYPSGEILLGSDMTFFVAPSATIIGTNDHGKYPLREPGKSLCAHRQLGRGLLYGENIRNITVTGGGMLDGNGRYRFKMNDPAGDKRTEDARPDIIYITYSNEINIENINFRRSAFWTVVPLSSRNITIKNLRLNCMNTPNRDGIDPVDCKNITVNSCNIMAGDDGLCFKSSDTFGCRNIDVYDMMISSLASAIKFGTDTYFCLEHARFADCFIKNVNRCGVSLETVDGASVSDVLFERLDITDAAAPAYVVTGCRNRLPRDTEEIRMSKIDGVTFRNLNFRLPRTHGHPLPIYETMVVGQSFEQSIDNLTFDGCNLEVMGGVSHTGQPAPEPINKSYPEYDRHGLSAGYAFTFKNCKNPELKNIRITDMINPDERPLAAFFECKKQ